MHRPRPGLDGKGAGDAGYCRTGCNALHPLPYEGRPTMAAPAERMKAVRARRRARGLRELRLVVPDASSDEVRKRIAAQVARLNPDDERAAMEWIEAVSEFDADTPR